MLGGNSKTGGLGVDANLNNLNNSDRCNGSGGHSLNFYEWFSEDFPSKTWEEARVLKHFRMLREQGSWRGARWPVLASSAHFLPAKPSLLGASFLSSRNWAEISSLPHQG